MVKKEKNNQRKFEEVRKLLTMQKEENPITKGVIYDKMNEQISLKLPKEICLAKKIDKNSEFIIVQNPTEERWKEIQKLDLVIYLKEK